MDERRALVDGEIEEALLELPGWRVVDGKLFKSYKFGSFAQAMGWMVSVAIYADKMDHHPEWSNVYNRVQVSLVTHDLENQISSWDVALARIMETLSLNR
jgi:4a-hydroxytetrahydrobiopterin dehydratase